MRISHRVIAVLWIAVAFSCNRAPVEKNSAGEDSETINEETRRLISAIEVTNGVAKVSASIFAIPDSWLERHLKPEQVKTLSPAVGVIPKDRQYDGLVIAMPLTGDLAAMAADYDVFVMAVRGNSAKFHRAGKDRVMAADGNRAPALRVRLSEPASLKGRPAAPLALALVSMRDGGSLGLVATAKPEEGGDSATTVVLPEISDPACMFPGCDKLTAPVSSPNQTPESPGAAQPEQPPQPAVPSNEVVLTPTPSPPKTCCACVYQDGGTANGSCASRETEAKCGNTVNGPCHWTGKSCIPAWKEDCNGADSPFQQAMKAAGNSCDVTGSFPNTTFIDNPVEGTPSLKTWPRDQKCTSIVTWYTGHGQNYADTLPIQLCEACQGGDNSFTCTGCSGMCGKDDEAITKQLCDELKKAEKAGSISTTGNQTCVKTYDAMSPKTITVSWEPGKEDCTSSVTFGPCSGGLKSCDTTDARNKVSYQCTNSSGIVVTKTCKCGWASLIGFSCGFE